MLVHASAFERASVCTSGSFYVMLVAVCVCVCVQVFVFDCFGSPGSHTVDKLSASQAVCASAWEMLAVVTAALFF